MNIPSLFDSDAVYHPEPILDAAEARARRDRAVEQVEQNASQRWKASAYDAIRDISSRREEFTTDDVWQALSDRGVVGPHEPRALGAVMLRAARDGLISATNKIEQSARPVCHAAPKRVWRSLTCAIGHDASLR